MTFRESITAGIALATIAGVFALSSTAQASGPMDIAAITIEPAAGLPFGDSEVDNYSLSQSVGLRSAGIADLHITSIHFTGPDAAEFALDVTMPCPATLIATSSCSFPVFFAPKTLGPKVAALEVESNALEGTVSIPLTGNGIPEAIRPTPAPRAYFTRKPASVLKTRLKKVKSVKVGFSSGQTGATFQCSVDGGPFSSCRSPFVIRNVKTGNHAIRVKAAAEGRTGPPATTRFKVLRIRK